MPSRRTHKKHNSLSSHSSPCVGYCVKCKCKQSMTKCKRAKTKNNRFMMKGVCPKCSTKMNKFI